MSPHIRYRKFDGRYAWKSSEANALNFKFQGAGVSLSIIFTITYKFDTWYDGTCHHLLN